MAVGLGDLLTEKTIKLNAQAADWRESVRLAGELLVAVNAVSPSYVEGMIRVVEELGPYMVVAPGIALAHARPEDGVQRMCMSLVRLVSPVEFGSRANDPVDLVFAFGAEDKQGHIQALQELAVFLQNEDAVTALRQCDSVQEAVQLIRDYSRKGEVDPTD
ncbi:MAG: PTS sugar transporter subunit IIA [Anaerolineae bacterium]|nr:PTS sugar transporter subunit IIA [Anaerolineae bacterium]